MFRFTGDAAASLAAALTVTLVPSAGPALAQSAPASPVAQQLTVAAQSVDAALVDLQNGDLAQARAHYGAYDDAWDLLEDGIRDPHPDVYETVERAMDGVEDTLLKVDNPSPATAADALRALRQTIDGQAPLLG
jgi:hypothetical protein